jgi:hypothetical protein
MKKEKPMTPLPQKCMKRLPCRGCMASCKYYSTCDGKLWRMPIDRQVSRDEKGILIRALRQN